MGTKYIYIFQCFCQLFAPNSGYAEPLLELIINQSHPFGWLPYISSAVSPPPYRRLNKIPCYLSTYTCYSNSDTFRGRSDQKSQKSYIFLRLLDF